MKNLSGRIMICLTAALFIFQAATFGFSFTEGEVNTELTAGEEASLQDDRADRKDSRTIYDLPDYEKNEIAVMDRDGTVRLITCKSKTELKEQLASLKQDPEVEFYQPNFEYTADAVQTEPVNEEELPVFFGAPEEQETMPAQIEKRESVNIAGSHPVYPSDPYYYLQWGLNNNAVFTGAGEKVVPQEDVDINAPEAWSVYKAKRPVTIALIDTGAEYMNQEISSSIWINEDEIPDNGIDDDGNGYIDDVRGWNFYNNNNQIYNGEEDHHGTHCAVSMTGAANGSMVCGIADYSNIKLMVLKTLGGSNGEGSTVSIMKAIQYAEDNGVSICNLSLGTSVNDYLLYRTMKKSSMLFVTAAGNSSSSSQGGKNIDLEPCYPASYSLENILSVGNIDASGNLHYTSNYGQVSVDLAAPGTDILGISSGDRLAFMTGTSMAAPMVTAAAAMIYTVSYDRSVLDTAVIIKKTVKKLPALSDAAASGGMLDLYAALSWR